MRKILFTAILIIIVMALPRVSFSQLLSNPESVEYDSGQNRHFVSNFGDGSIVQIDNDGTQSYFNTTLSRIAGIHIKDNVLYAAANLAPYIGVYGFDITTAEMVFSVEIPSIGLLNDVTTDTSGFLYVTDYYDHKIFKVDIENQTYSLFVDTVLDWPNGIIYDIQLNRLLVLSVNASGRPIHAVSLEDSTVTVAVYTYLTGLDGMAYDSDHRLYLSSWTTDAVHRYNPDLTGPLEVFSTGHDDPADIFIDSNNLLCVPNFYWNSVDFVQIEPVSIDNEIEISNLPQKFVLYPNYPNPFNSATTFSFYVPSATDVLVNIYDLSGRNIDSFNLGFTNAGHHKFDWSPKEISTGIYFYEIKSDEWKSTRKLTYLK